MNVNNMTAQQAADWCAKDDGWQFEYNASKFKWWKPAQLIMPSGKPSPFLGRTWSNHPNPLTLDGAAAALPEGWTLWDMEQRGKGWVVAAIFANHEREICIDGPDELTARYRLAVLCRMAEKEAAK